MKTELFVKLDFTASHSLGPDDKPHPHLWRVEARTLGEARQGKIVDLPEFRNALEEVTAGLKNTFLNENPRLDTSARAYPTCETLGTFFLNTFDSLIQKRFLSVNPTVRLISVTVTLFDANGAEIGATRVSG